jgi:glycoprotein endo-alpha-1,2-mannosidase
MTASLLFTLFMMFATEGYPVILDISTTSDWTELNFNNVDVYYINDTIFSDSTDKSKPWLGIFSIRKKPFDSTLIRARFEILLQKNLPSDIEISVIKGSIGYTKVDFLTTEAETLTSFIGYEQKENFTIKGTVFQKIISQTYQLYPNKLKIEPLVLAFYYPWYESNWFDNDSQYVAHKPLLGFYSSSDETVIRNHIVMAKQAGIDGFIVSWWGKNSLIDNNLKKFIPICESLDFKFTFYLEEAKSKADMESTLRYIEKEYAHHPAFIKINSHPVISFFHRIIEQVTLDSIKTINSRFYLINFGYAPSNLDGFFGFHEYLPIADNPLINKSRYLFAAQIARKKNKLIATPVMPGFDDRRIRSPGLLIKRENGDFYRKVWEAAIASKPDWVLITSFNEWFEGTEIEPSKEYEDFYLNLTRYYSELFKKNAYRD